MSTPCPLERPSSELMILCIASSKTDGEASKHHIENVGETCWLGKMGTQSSCRAADDTGKRTRGGPAAQRHLRHHRATLLWNASTDCDIGGTQEASENIGFRALIQDSPSLHFPLPYYLSLLLPHGKVVTNVFGFLCDKSLLVLMSIEFN